MVVNLPTPSLLSSSSAFVIIVLDVTPRYLRVLSSSTPSGTLTRDADRLNRWVDVRSNFRSIIDSPITNSTRSGIAVHYIGNAKSVHPRFSLHLFDDRGVSSFQERDGGTR